MTLSHVDMEMSNPTWIDFSFSCPFCSQRVEANTDLQRWFCKGCLSIFSFNSKKGMMSCTQMQRREIPLPKLIEAVLKSNRRRKK